jgi:hypothetical protein
VALVFWVVFSLVLVLVLVLVALVLGSCFGFAARGLRREARVRRRADKEAAVLTGRSPTFRRSPDRRG